MWLVFLLPVVDCLDCHRRSQEYRCKGTGHYSETVEICDLIYQVCSYEAGSKPKCIERNTVIDAVQCNSTTESQCACDYNDDGYPVCVCAGRSLLKRMGTYTWLGVIVCLIMAAVCVGLFIHVYRRRRLKRQSQPSAPPPEAELLPPSYEAALEITQHNIWVIYLFQLQLYFAELIRVALWHIAHFVRFNLLILFSTFAPHHYVHLVDSVLCTTMYYNIHKLPYWFINISIIFSWF